jgi:hypothetical protein
MGSADEHRKMHQRDSHRVVAVGQMGSGALYFSSVPYSGFGSLHISVLVLVLRVGRQSCRYPIP